MRTLTALTASVILGLVAVPSRAPAARQHCADVRAQRFGVLLLDRLHSALSEELGYQRGFLPLLADDVVLLVPGQPILQGKAAATAYYATRDPSERLSWTPTRIDAAVDGRLGTQWGWTTATVQAADGTTVTTTGRNMVVWERRGLSWKVAVYLQANSAPPQPTPAGFGLFPDETRRCVSFGDPDDFADEIADTDTDFAALSVAQGYGIAFKTYAAPDAALRAAGQLFIGPDAIFSLFGDTPPSVETLDWAPSLSGAASSGDLGWSVGVASDTVFDPAGDQVFYSKYVTLWKRQPDGTFRYTGDSGNSAPAP